jgi:hypothetical protein
MRGGDMSKFFVEGGWESEGLSGGWWVSAREETRRKVAFYCDPEAFWAVIEAEDKQEAISKTIELVRTKYLIPKNIPEVPWQ